jgi:hypothetical protein
MEQSDFGAGIAGHAAASATLAILDIDALADELHFAASNLHNAGPEMRPGLYRLADLPGPSGAQDAAASRIRNIGQRLFARGGAALMSEVYDRAVERHDWRGVRGVSPQWDGIGPWAT